MSHKSSGAYRDLAFSAVVTDAFDGAIRLLSDVQRFGFRIRAFHVGEMALEGVSVQMTLAVPQETDDLHICSRMARHATVVSLESA